MSSLSDLEGAVEWREILTVLLVSGAEHACAWALVFRQTQHPLVATSPIGVAAAYERNRSCSRWKKKCLAEYTGETGAIRANPSAIDCRIRISSARSGEMVQGTRRVCRHSSGDGCSSATPHGLGHNRNRASLWRGLPDRVLHSSGECSSHHPACGRNRHGAPAIWLQLDQADERHQRESTVRAAGIRNRSPLHCLHRNAGANWSNTLVRR